MTSSSQHEWKAVFPGPFLYVYRCNKCLTLITTLGQPTLPKDGCKGPSVPKNQQRQRRRTH